MATGQVAMRECSEADLMCTDSDAELFMKGAVTAELRFSHSDDASLSIDCSEHNVEAEVQARHPEQRSRSRSHNPHKLKVVHRLRISIATSGRELSLIENLI
ncbi:unnamed protein product [Pleuronectes platessa]|uniref:Uncharacterized protein n=1 Tax=Pleuronectes platessa TaxID=8262 RepID=A0A9N7YKA0_PLEPL|nr:unnamed protein product [Pleuronectes platessa]